MIRSWLLRIAVIATVAVAFNGIAIAQNPPAPMMTQELMGRLIKFTRALEETSKVDARLCKILEACDGTNLMEPFKLAQASSARADYMVAIPANGNSGDIILMRNSPTVMDLYLTDKTAKLRAAAISDGDGIRLITNETANNGFEAVLAIFAAKAVMLPPTTVAPGNVTR